MSKSTRMAWRRLVLAAAAVSAAGGMPGAPAWAASGPDTWEGNTSNAWNVGSNWNPATNAPPASGDSLIFGAAGSSGTTLLDNLMTPATYNIAGITFNAGAAAFTITPGTAGTNGFTLTGDVANNSTSLQTLNDLIAATTARTFTTTAGGGDITVGGIISGTGGGVTKAGAGILTLSGVNTYTGTTTVSAGTLVLSGNRTAAAGAITVANATSTNATLNISNGTFATSTFAVGTGTGAAGTVNQTGGSLTMGGNQLLVGNGTATGTYNLSGGTLTTFAGTLGVVVGVNSNSTGFFNLSGTGTLAMPATSTLQIARSDNAIATNSTGTFSQTGGTATVGILQMGGSNTSPATANAGANATLSLTGGTFSAVTFNQLSGANNSTSQITLGGTAQVTLPAFPTARGTGATATLTFDGGTLLPAAASTAYLSGLTNAFITGNGAKFNVAVSRDITVAQAFQDAASQTGSLTKSGVGVLTLSGANTYSGGGAVSAGTLTYLNTTAKPSTGTTTVAAGATLGLGVGGANSFTSTDVDALFANTLPGVNSVAGSGVGFDTSAGAFTYATSQSAARSLSKLGANTLTLMGANTYTGSTNISAGTLALSGGDNRLPTATTVNFLGAAGTLDVGATNQTIAALTVPTSATTAVALTATINGTNGSLNVGGGSDLQLGPFSTGFPVTVNMAGLSNFAYNSTTKTFRVGLQSGGTVPANTTNQVGTVTLASSNTIKALLFAVGDQGSSGAPGKDTLNLGQTNTLSADTFNIGYSNRSGAILQFATGLTSPQATFGGTNGGAVTAFNIGLVADNANNTWVESADFSAGTVTGSATTMTIGVADAGVSTTRQGTSNASFVMGAGTVTVGTLNLGRIANTGGNGTTTGTTTGTYAGNGTFTVNNAAAVVNAGTIKFAENTITASTGTMRSVSGTFNLTNGTLKATNLLKGTQTGTALSANAALNWTNGTLQNTDAANLTITAVPITLLSGSHVFNVTGTQTATVDAASPISGTGFTLTKTGTGILNLLATNTFSGLTSVNAGRLLVNGSLAGPATVNGAASGGADGATLGGSGTIGGAVTLTSGSIVSPGNSIATLTTGAETWNGGASYVWEIKDASGGPTAAAGTNWDKVAVNGTLTTPGSGVFTIKLTSLNPGTGAAGQAGNFDPSQSYAWTIATTTGLSGSVDAGTFQVDTSGFANTFDGTFGVAASGNDVQVLYTATVPEPTGLAVLAGAVALLTRRRRRAASGA